MNCNARRFVSAFFIFAAVAGCGGSATPAGQPQADDAQSADRVDATAVSEPSPYAGATAVSLTLRGGHVWMGTIYLSEDERIQVLGKPPLHEVVDKLAEVPELRRIHVGFHDQRDDPPLPVGEACRQIARIRSVENLSMQNGPFSAEGLAPLKAMPRLRIIEFTGTEPSADAYAVFAEIESLKAVLAPTIRRTGREYLKNVRPDIKLYNHGDYAP